MNLHLISIGAMLLLLCSACATLPPQVNYSRMTIDFVQPAEELQQALSKAIVALPVRVLHTEGTEMHAETEGSLMPGGITASIISMDAGHARLEITHEFTNHGGYRALPPGLLQEIRKAMSEASGRIIPIATSGEGQEGCDLLGSFAPLPNIPGEASNGEGRMPDLIGGLQGVQRRVRYPEAARAAGTEGTVLMEFIVGTEGQVECASALMGAPNGITEHALDVIMGSRFTPGMADGEPVRVRLSLPITLRLR